jgi:hypothetical protein
MSDIHIVLNVLGHSAVQSVREQTFRTNVSPPCSVSKICRAIAGGNKPVSRNTRMRNFNLTSYCIVRNS